MDWALKGNLWFMAGASIPVIIHLLHRQKFKRVRWAAMEWLLAAIKKTQRRLQLENLLLLLLRILIMILLALAIARPRLTGAASTVLGESDTHYIFVVDTSYSMEYKKESSPTSSLELAKKACLKLVGELQPTSKDRFTVFSMSEFPETPLSAWNEISRVKETVEDLKPRQFGSDMLTMFLELQKVLDRTSPDAPKNIDRKVYFFTDLQRYAWEYADEKQSRRFVELMKNLSHMPSTWFHIIDVGTPDSSNRAILDLRVANKVVTSLRPVELQVDLFNFSARQADRQRVQLLVDGQVYETQIVPIPTGHVITLHFKYTFGKSDVGPHLFEARFDPQDAQYDSPSVDNHRFLAVEVREAIRALLVDGEPKDGKIKNRETGTLDLALSSTGYFSVQWVATHNFGEQELEKYDFIALCNVKSLRSDLLEKLEEFVERGGGLFISLGNQVDPGWYNDEMAQCKGIVVDEPTGKRCLKCGETGIQAHTEKRMNSEGKEITVQIHVGGRGLLPATLGDTAVGKPPDLHSAGDPRRLSKVNVDHKIFSLFKRVGMAQPYSLVFWKYFPLEEYEPSQVLAEFDDIAHSPFLVERSWHEGKVILMSTAIDGEEDWNSSFTGRGPYLVMALNLGEYLASRSISRRNFHVGELLQVYLRKDVQREFRLFSPTGSSEQVIARFRSDRDQFMEIRSGVALMGSSSGSPTLGLERSGKYTLVKADAAVADLPTAIFGVNVGPEKVDGEQIRTCEGNLDLLPREEFKRRFPDFKFEFLGEKNERGDEVKFTPPDSEIGKKLLFALLGFLLVESLLACLFGRSKQ